MKKLIFICGVLILLISCSNTPVDLNDYCGARVVGEGRNRRFASGGRWNYKLQLQTDTSIFWVEVTQYNYNLYHNKLGCIINCK